VTRYAGFGLQHTARVRPTQSVGESSDLRRFKDLISTARPLLIVAAALIAAYLLYPRPSRTQLEGPAGPRTQIVFWTPGGVSDHLRVGVEAFERRHPQYTVLIGSATVRDATADPTSFLLGVAGGVPPDLIYFDRFAVVRPLSLRPSVAGPHPL